MMYKIAPVLRDGYVLVSKDNLEVLQMPGETLIVAYFNDEGHFEICENYFSLSSKTCVDKCNTFTQS